ncbi:glycosyltransferase [Oculatella sp. LEGE 06141]|uniref:glycosyltransferase n=1 Tax=Oculatella sp. LEGE 06141 TaxID=1828648 RepID=UPI00187F0D04|nr:glycosyltransferase [Oculatella sp. LEGE 06141]MBE9180451.1 glycosyltransferase [Oculatella sp. LEGE 06141]
MHIVLIPGSYQPDRCGVAHYTARLRTVLAERGVTSTVLTTHAAAAVASNPTVVGAGHAWQLTDLLPLLQAIRSTPADVLHIQHAAGSYGFQRAIFLLPWLLRRVGYRQPIVTTAHEYGWWEWHPNRIPPRLLEWLKQWGQQRGWWDQEDGFLLTGSNAIITTNANAKTIIRSRLPQLGDRLHFIPIGANVEVVPIERSLAQAQLRQQYGWSTATQVIAFFGFLHPVKGLETLLPAFQQVVQQAPQARLLLIGGVESLALRGEDAQRYWQQLHQQVADLGLTHSVKLTGYVDAATASHYLSGADIGVLPFNHGITLKSGSLLTLFAHRLPTIATRKEQLDAELDDRHVIHLVPPRDPAALTQALLTVLQDAALRDRLSQRAASLAQRFQWETIARQHLEIYQAVCRQTNRDYSVAKG